jgi:hypothetical protein
MPFPQPPQSAVSQVACGEYKLWTALGSLEYFASNGTSIGESESQIGYGPFITNSPTTIQEWYQYLASLFSPWPSNETSASGNGLENIALSAGECVTGAANAFANEEQQSLFLAGVLGALQIIPGADVLADTAVGLATVVNIVYGCASFAGGNP